MSPDRDNIRFNTLRNALYHSARRRTHERTSRVFNFLLIVLGAATVSEALAASGTMHLATGIAVTVIAALQLVFDFGRKARDHAVLQRDYYHLLADIEARPTADAGQCADWQRRLAIIAADEPPILRAIDARAYNDALDATDAFDRDERLVIPWRHRALGGLVTFDGHEYRKRSELAA